MLIPLRKKQIIFFKPVIMFSKTYSMFGAGYKNIYRFFIDPLLD